MTRRNLTILDIREQEFADLQGRLDPGTMYRVVDTTGRPIRTVTADGQVVGGGNYLATVFVDPPSGADDTAALLAKGAEASAIWVAAGRPRFRRVALIFPQFATYLCDGHLWHSGVEYIGNGCIIKKLNDGSNTLTGTPYNRTQFCAGVISSYDAGNATWYGNGDDIVVRDITYDQNGKTLGLGGIYAVNVRRFRAYGLKHIHSTGSIQCYGWVVRGRDIYTDPDCSSIGGRMPGADGLHINGGRDMLFDGGYWEAGDDAVAVNWEGASGTNISTLPFDDEAIGPNIVIRNPQVYSLKAHGFRADVPIQKYAGTVRSHKIDGVRVVGMTGYAGLARNGGINIIDNTTPGYDTFTTDLRNVRVEGFDLTVGSTQHDGVNPWGVNVQNAQDVTVQGLLRFVAPTQRTAGYQDVLFSTPPVGFSLTQLVPATTYNFTIAVNGDSPSTINVVGANAQTFDALIAALNAAMNAAGVQATAELWPQGGTTAIRFLSKSIAVGSAIALTTGTLFTAPLRWVTGLGSATPGAAPPVFNLGGVRNGVNVTLDVTATVPDGGGWTITPLAQWGHIMHRDITLAGTLTMTSTQTQPSVNIINTPGFVHRIRHEGLNTSQLRAVSFFAGFGPWPILACTPSASSNTATVEVAGDQTFAPLASLIAIAGNEAGKANRIYTIGAKSFSAGTGRTTFTLREPMDTAATASGWIISPTSVFFDGGKFARAEPYTGILQSNSTAINPQTLGRFAAMRLRSVDFTKCGTPIRYTSGTDNVSLEPGDVEIVDCPGLRTRAGGLAQVASAGTSVTVSLAGILDVPLAGATATVLQRQVRITPISDTVGVRWWVSAGADRWSFVINTNVAPGGSGVNFGWSVDTGRR